MEFNNRTTEVFNIVNMQQNYFYLSKENSKDELVNVYCGQGGKIVFAWRKSQNIRQWYSEWCDRRIDR